MKDFKDLIVWRKAHAMVLALYPITQTFPKEELYGITSQIRRASFSIPTNIAEACCRNSDSEFGRFLTYSMGSASELEYLLLISCDLNFLPQEKYIEITAPLIEVKKMLYALIKKSKVPKA